MCGYDRYVNGAKCDCEECEIKIEISKWKEKEMYGENAMVRFIAMNMRINLKKKLQEKEDYEWELNEIRNGR